MDKWLNINSLHSSPLPHETLPDEVIARIQAVAETLAEVDDMPLAQWIADFQRDAHPEKEVAVWENIAGAYQEKVAQHPTWSLARKKKLLTGLLLASMELDPLKVAPTNSDD